MTTWNAPETSLETNRCMFCEQSTPGLKVVSYPPSMAGGLVCEACYLENEYILASEQETK